MIEVGKLRYGDVIVPTAGASGYVYVYLGRPDGGQAALLVVTPNIRRPNIVRMWLANPAAWEKVP